MVTALGNSSACLNSPREESLDFYELEKISRESYKAFHNQQAVPMRTITRWLREIDPFIRVNNMKATELLSLIGQLPLKE